MGSSAVPLADRLPHDNRVEKDSFNVVPAVFPTSAVPEGTDVRKVATDTIAAVNERLAAEDYKGVGALFAEEGQWRDHLGVSWNFRTVQGPAKIADFLSVSSAGQKLERFAVDDLEPQRVPAVGALDAFGKSPCVVVYTTFASSVGTGRGIARLIHDSSSGLWKIYAFYTALQELTGYEQLLGARRPLGASHGGGRNMKNWREQRDEDVSFTVAEPSVLVLGAGQGGLTLAARLKMLGVQTLVVDREERVGDNWRKRYRQLVLHDPVWFDHLPYMPFPAFWPVFTPKDKLADFFEAYVALLELNVWTRAEIKSLEYDAAAKRYNVTVERVVPTTGAKETRSFHPQHIVQATGHSGKKNMPDVPGIDSFQGELLCHSSEFPGAQPPPENTAPNAVRRAVVVGSCNSGHDIAQDLYENGYDVTIVQRSSTCVVSSKAIVDIGLGALYSEAVQAKLPVDDADLLLWSVPTNLSKAVQVQATQLEIEHDTTLLEGLQKAGFALDRGTDGAGLFFKYFQRGGGYYIDVGASQLIIDGKIKVKSGHGIQQVTPTGLDLADGTHLPADIVVFATGYQNMRTQTRVLFGDRLAAATRDVWGFDKEGEFRTMWRGSGQPGYWYMGGNLALARYFGRFLALQIKAQQEGLMPYA
ncbi:FAD dependent oxidoreductase [Sporothrix brasiliensis 5110]|uniref:FAD dependent oxidoreductase n=1 Tax=Sporothrix brasiliensis 5110 TaxID=1398154 RepID=A0A0C2F5X2_9PEZI|nr:FAD dependent oxidoreductase [Sporothrix brasiliensis 5110]KIH86433.1 FAD dependent oxidoreductase [Sporothrix brasiliensis 5110]